MDMVDLKELPKMLRDAADALEAMPSGQTGEKDVSLEAVRAVLVRRESVSRSRHSLRSMARIV